MSDPSYMGLAGDDQVRTLINNPRSKTFQKLRESLGDTVSGLGKYIAGGGFPVSDLTDPSKPAGAALGATYVAFTDVNGNPLPPGHIVQIRLTSDLSDIDNIVAVAQ